MSGLWGRRTVRHLTICIAPLLLVGVALVVVLATRFASVAAPVRQATAEARATVTQAGLGADGKEVELRWTDTAGQQHLTRVRVPEVNGVRTGVQVTVKYDPDDPSRVYVGGDETSIRLRDLAFGIFVATIVPALALLVTVVHVVRRLAAERRPTTTLPVSYVRSKKGLVQRSWLVLDDRGREWCVPVHWEPALASLLAKTPCPVHGRPLTDRVLVVDVDGTKVWQSLRKRSRGPSADIVTATTAWSKSAERKAAAEPPPPAGLGRQLRGDAVLVVIAPLLGLLWAYVDGSGIGGFAAGSALMAGVLFWVPALFGSDPT
jgi:hypothetical protein